MSQPWLQQQERGTVFAMKLIVWVSLLLGRRLGRALLVPVTSYFMISSPAARRASRDYLRRVLDREPGWRHLFRHFYTFASVLLDRAFFVSGRLHYFRINKYGLETPRDVAAAGRGCLFLGAHLGSFEVVRIGAARKWGLTIHMMMYERNALKIKRVMESMQGGVTLKVLPIGSVDAMIQAKQCSERGEMLAILGDRSVAQDKTVTVPFLGREAVFPVGPILAAAALKLPVVLFFGLYMGGNAYEEHFELFAERVDLGRGDRQEAARQWVRRYAERLEAYCRKAPYNWFNFFDFWQPALPEAAVSSSSGGSPAAVRDA